ncbi:MAG: hypothetical protein BWZ10_01079 [candidate division BRC1 bacterium ADurb.BinA364]|nr:MAG: hypothetical protein BWZ10_01079 [candidate division BRC1 bacterium ADurb.BinA364]
MDRRFGRKPNGLNKSVGIDFYDLAGNLLGRRLGSGFGRSARSRGGRCLLHHPRAVLRREFLGVDDRVHAAVLGANRRSGFGVGIAVEQSLGLAFLGNFEDQRGLLRGHEKRVAILGPDRKHIVRFRLIKRLAFVRPFDGVESGLGSRCGIERFIPGIVVQVPDIFLAGLEVSRRGIVARHAIDQAAGRRADEQLVAGAQRQRRRFDLAQVEQQRRRRKPGVVMENLALMSGRDIQIAAWRLHDVPDNRFAGFDDLA